MYKIYPSLLDAYNWYLKSESPECKQEMIDKINRVPFQSDAADKGTAFNELVDFVLLHGFLPEHTNVEMPHKIKLETINDFVERLHGAVPQQYVEAEIETDNGTVLLYGYADEILGDACIDIKTTSNYTFPKYLHNWQHIVYPYCLNNSGIECTVFRYLITDFNAVYTEDYIYDPVKSVNKLKAYLNDFIFFLEMNRKLITDKKIFNEEMVVA